MFSQLSDKQRGSLLGVSAYLIWGFAALYWARTAPVDAADLLAHRALWSVPVIILFLAFARRLTHAFALIKDPKAVGILACAAIFSATNWGIFLWAVTHERATEASLGYFLLPLLNVVIGLTLFKESIDLPQKVAVAFALAGMFVQIVYYGGLPFVSLGLALSFSLYGAVRKAISIGPLEGQFIEVVLMAPFALAWLVWNDWGGLGQHGVAVDAFLMGAGLMTVVPLIAYVAASRMLPLTALGLVFYIGPTSQLLVAIFYFDEPFERVQLLSFGLVWVGLAIVSMSSLRRLGNSSSVKPG